MSVGCWVMGVAALAACAAASADAIRDVVDPETGLTVRYVTNAPCVNTLAYPTCRSWHRDSRRIFVETDRSRSKDDGPKVLNEILMIDTQTGENKTLVSLAEPQQPLDPADPRRAAFYRFDYAPEANVLAYFDIRCHSFYMIDPDTGRAGCVLKHDPGTIGNPPSISPDGKRLVYYAVFEFLKNKYFGGRVSAMFALDVDPVNLKAGGEPRIITAYASRIVESARKQMPGGVIVNHTQVNPKDHDHYCYSHEFGGAQPDGSLTLTRMWENRDGLDRPIYRPKPGEWQTHELFGPLGRMFYFVENWGVCSIDLKTYEKRVIYDGKPIRAIHISVSPDEKWIAADSWDFAKLDADGNCPGAIFLIEVATGKSKLLCRVPAGAQQPRHLHPNFSTDGRKVAFTVADGKNSQVALVDITKVIRDW